MKNELKRVCVKPYDKDRFEVIQDYEFFAKLQRHCPKV